MTTIRKPRATKSCADIDRNLSDKLLMNYVSTAVLLVVFSISVENGITKQSLLSSVVALIAIAIQIRVFKAIVRIILLRKRFRSDPEQFRNESGLYTMPDTSRR